MKSKKFANTLKRNLKNCSEPVTTSYPQSSGIKGGGTMQEEIKGLEINLSINIKNRNELDELLETIQKDIAALKNDFDKLDQFKLKFDLE